MIILHFRLYENKFLPNNQTASISKKMRQFPVWSLSEANSTASDHSGNLESCPHSAIMKLQTVHCSVYTPENDPNDRKRYVRAFSQWATAGQTKGRQHQDHSFTTDVQISTSSKTPTIKLILKPFIAIDFHLHFSLCFNEIRLPKMYFTALMKQTIPRCVARWLKGT